jgi:hypothetical protein
MKRIALFLACVSLSACQTPVVIGGGDAPVAVGEKVLVPATNAFADAADGYAVVSNTLAAAIRQGAFTQDQLAMIRTLKTHADKLLNNGVAGLTLAERAASLSAAVAQLRSIAGAR